MQPKQVVRQLRETVSRYGARAALYDLQCRIINRAAEDAVIQLGLDQHEHGVPATDDERDVALKAGEVVNPRRI